ncbi:MAG: ATP-binding protein [Firmicutes bacterium]|nr:ATP-binding protein [Bacillota bacterium]
MLQKLGKRLTLLNMVISGAILLAMALVALGIAEGMIATQYKNDLAMYARSVFSILFRTMGESVEYIVQTPERYMVAMENNLGDLYISEEHMPMERTVRGIAALVRQRFAEERKQEALGKKQEPDGAGMAPPGLPRRIAGGITSRIMRETVQGIYFAVPTVVTNAEPFLTAGANGMRYRVSAMQILLADQESLILVAQDRSDELRAIYRLRWLFASCIAVGLILIFMASLYLSRRAIEPVDHSIEQQRAFVAAASHELRTPLAALGANAEVLADAPLGEYAPYLESVLHVSRRMALLVSDLMDLARADAGELSVQMLPVDLNEVAAKAVQWMRPLAEQKSIEIVQDLKPTALVGDGDRLRQVLLALLDNAVRYTPQGGQIFVSVQREGRCARVCVADTGEGIDDAHKARVFERFYRVDKARSRENGGFGLGLSIVKQLVEQMEGTITLTDHESGGALFDIRFKAVG